MNIRQAATHVGLCRRPTTELRHSPSPRDVDRRWSALPRIMPWHVVNIATALMHVYLNRKAFPMTEAELKLIANAAIIGDNSHPVQG